MLSSNNDQCHATRLENVARMEATRQICSRWERDQYPRIIAMTTNAMQGDREMCLQAGMDEYIAKPI